MRVSAQVAVPAVVREIAAPPVPSEARPEPPPSPPVSAAPPVVPPPVPERKMPPAEPHRETSPVREPASNSRPAEEPVAEAGPPAAAGDGSKTGAEAVKAEAKAAKKEEAKKAKAAKEGRPGPRKEQRRSGILLPVMVMALLLLGAGATWFFISRMLAGGNTPPPVDAALQSRIQEERYRKTGWQDEAREVLEQFLGARTTAGKAAWSLRGSELLPEMEAFYGGADIDDSDTPASAFSAMELLPEDVERGIHMFVYDLPPQFELKEFFRPLAPLEVQYGLERADVLLASMAQVSNFESGPLKVYAFFKRTPDGLRLDWETFVQTKYRTFRNFIEIPEAGRARVFRVYLLEDVPEKGRAPAGTRTYRVVDPAHTSDAVRVSVPVDSEMGRALSILNWRGIKDARPSTKTATVELEWSQEESPRVLLKRFICWEFLGIGGEAVGKGTGR